MSIHETVPNRSWGGDKGDIYDFQRGRNFKIAVLFQLVLCISCCRKLRSKSILAVRTVRVEVGELAQGQALLYSVHYPSAAWSHIEPIPSCPLPEFFLACLLYLFAADADTSSCLLIVWGDRDPAQIPRRLLLLLSLYLLIPKTQTPLLKNIFPPNTCLFSFPAFSCCFRLKFVFYLPPGVYDELDSHFWQWTLFNSPRRTQGPNSSWGNGGRVLTSKHILDFLTSRSASHPAPILPQSHLNLPCTLSSSSFLSLSSSIPFACYPSSLCIDCIILSQHKLYSVSSGALSSFISHSLYST